MKTVNIVVLNWNNPTLTIDSINSILEIEHVTFSYFISLIDNGSTDNSIEQFENTYSQNSNIEIIKTNSNLGFVDGNNVGIKNSVDKGFDYTLIINNDVIVKPDFLQKLINFIDNNQEYSIVGPKIYFAPGHEYQQNLYAKDELGKVIWSYGGSFDKSNVIGTNSHIDEVDNGQLNADVINPDFVSGCCMLIDNKVIKDIGMFDSKFFMYLEDVDFCYRAINKGYKLAIVSSSQIWHINAGSSNAGGSLHDYFLTRNRMIFAFKHLSYRTKFAIIRQSLIIYFTSPSIWQKRAIFDFYISKLGKGSWGEK